MTPVPLRLQITQAQLGSHSQLDPCHAVGDFARDKLEAAPRAFMVKQDPTAAEHAVRFAVVHREMKAGYFTHAVRTSRMERCTLALRSLAHLAEHLARPGEVELALWLRLAQRRKRIVRAIDVGGQRRKSVGETFRHEALGGEMITLVKLVLSEHVENARIAIQVGR